MIYNKNKEVTLTKWNDKDIIEIYRGPYLVWALINNISCYSSGYWLDDNPWTDDTPWKDNP